MSKQRAEVARRATDVFAHKFYAPPAYGAVRREMLLARVQGESPPRIVVVQAPAGHGKSTLLEQLKSSSEAAGALTGWLTLDEADNDPRRLAAHLQALVASLGVSSSSAETDDIESDSGRRRLNDWLIQQCLLQDRPVALVFDEFQAITRKPVLAVFQDLLQRLPDTVRVFIGSRAMPEIGLARLIVQQQAVALRAEDIRFSREEVDTFFAAQQDAELSTTERDTVHRLTDGWPAAVQLFRLGLASPSVRQALRDGAGARPRELADYLADNVLSLQPERVRTFLLKTSLLRRLSAPLCDAITGWQDSQSMLLYLERSGLFVRSLDSELQWFKYHTLFSSFLAEQLRLTHPDVLADIHASAATWYDLDGQHEEAMYHAVAARDYAYAADIMNRWASHLIPDAGLTTVEDWSERLPMSEIEGRPDLAVKIAWALAFKRRMQKLRPIIDISDRLGADGDIRQNTSSDVVNVMLAVIQDELPKAFEILDRVPLADQHAEGFWAFELGAAANVAAYRAQIHGEYTAAREYVSLARGYGMLGSSAFSGGYTVALAGVNCLAQGRLDDALARFRTGLAEVGPDVHESLASGSLVACYVWALYEANRLDQAASLFQQFQDVISGAVLLDFVAVAYLSMARVHVARGRPDAADQVLETCEDIAHLAGWPRLLRLVGWERVRMALMSGDIERARTMVDRLPPTEHLPPGWMTFSGSIEANAIGACRLAIHDHRVDEALDMISEELVQATASGRVHRQIKLLMLEACAYQQRGSDNAALRSLRKALKLAQPGGYVRAVLDEGAPALSLLDKMSQSSAQTPASEDLAIQAFVEQLLSIAGIGGSDAATAQRVSTFQPVEPLTEREKEMLIFLGNGLSNKEMAQRLFVSENTVKFHLKNIYSKLAVSSRLQAINAARQMALL